MTRVWLQDGGYLDVVGEPGDHPDGFSVMLVRSSPDFEVVRQTNLTTTEALLLASSLALAVQEVIES